MPALIEAPLERAIAPARPTVRPGTLEPATRRLFRPRVRYVVLFLLLVAFVVVIARAWPKLFLEPPADIVRASGRIEGREFTLAPKDIQGRVRRLLVDEGDRVVAGQLVAELDAPQLDARRATASGNVAALDAEITQGFLDVTFAQKHSAASIAAANAAVSSARAQVVRALAVMANATADYQRAVTLLADRVISRRESEDAELQWRVSRADVEASEKEVARAEASLALARASADTIALKRQHVRALQEGRRTVLGQLAEAEANLAERQILAPTDGTILSRVVEVGDVVAAGAPMFRMVDLSRLYVKVYIPEPDVAKLRLGDSAEVYVDAFPQRSFAARVSKIHDEAEFTPKNVETAEERQKLVFGVELTFTDSDGVLKPGMPADGIIHWRPPAAASTGHGS